MAVPGDLKTKQPGILV